MTDDRPRRYALPAPTGEMPAAGEHETDCADQIPLFGSCEQCAGSGIVRVWIGDLPANWPCPACSGSGETGGEPAPFACGPGDIDESGGVGVP